ncbi:MAG: HAD-IIIA family hydrolase [Candidatus Sumerlaeia bacterium]|nr:HAD-IIIA family hydrolase [Candidatus Sumerlaeia bacterium]
MTEQGKFRAVALLDRDGTINEEVEYLSRAEDFELLPGAADAIRILNQENVAVIVTTNQSGIARGLLTEDDLTSIHERMTRELAEKGARIDGIYHAPVLPDSGDPRRKPDTGMYQAAVRDLGLQGLPVYSIGDRTLDVEFGINCGGKGIRVLTGHQLKEDVPLDLERFHAARRRGLTFTSENILEAVHLMLSDITLAECHGDMVIRRKFHDLYATQLIVSQNKARENRVVLAHGCFDLLHGGHVSYLEGARAMGDRLVLAVNSNASIGRIKGAGRPVLLEADRLQLLAAMECIDYITLFHDDTAERVIKDLSPDILAIGPGQDSRREGEVATARQLGIEVRHAGGEKEGSGRDIIDTVVERARAGLL